ncbi:hypothetical protein M409DRAFT_17625 [Zasmidium cellare ATCC 36951]|uniref:Acyltransferase C-terminal domain-containing protein n=1 Tax=Zasmidium cellare ATCC 36951 TaxID=1080233 RepID=A0A6A6CZ75_ZASCE|nr:uncharacterized protein M409DRAFT_17625 [Zasmidium cellare ATCC 36951]KAF2172391.1 hypothetical protein M409DRAFT_17625 [Zasmidium cellare ATCC 36951]
MYNSTIGYKGVPPGEYGQDIYGLKNIFAIKGTPYNDSERFDRWLFQRGAEKDRLLKHFQKHGCFPADPDDGYVRADIKLFNAMEAAQIFTGELAVVTAWWIAKFAFRCISKPPWKTLSALLALVSWAAA